MSLFNNFKIIVGILFGPLLLPLFKEQMILEILVATAGVIKKDSIFQGGW